MLDAKGWPGGGRNKQISENEEEIKVFYCLALKNEEDEEEIRNFGQNIYTLQNSKFPKIGLTLPGKKVFKILFWKRAII